MQKRYLGKMAEIYYLIYTGSNISRFIAPAVSPPSCTIALSKFKLNEKEENKERESELSGRAIPFQVLTAGDKQANISVSQYFFISMAIHRSVV